nr:hypothetical protein [Clostridia bacterium]
MIKENIEDINRIFNLKLQEQRDGNKLPGYIYYLGRPSSELKSTGIPDLPIELKAEKLYEKANTKGHEYDLESIKDMVNAIQHPLAIFRYGNPAKSQNIIVELQKGDRNFLVGLSLNPLVNDNCVEINSVRNIFPKENAEWLHWIEQGKLMRVDKIKIQNLIDKQRTSLADVEYLDLDFVTKLINKFDNPITEEEKIERISNISIRNEKERGFYISCKVDGKRMPKERIKDKDIVSLMSGRKDKEDLALKYYGETLNRKIMDKIGIRR